MNRVRIVLAGFVTWLVPCVWGPEVRCGAAELTVQVAYGSEKKGWIEDRRPNANMDPYVVTRLITDTVCSALA